MSKKKTPKPRYQVQVKNEGKFEGKVWVKKANMFCKYICFNTPNKSNIFEWIDENEMRLKMSHFQRQ